MHTPTTDDLCATCGGSYTSDTCLCVQLERRRDAALRLAPINDRGTRDPWVVAS